MSVSAPQWPIIESATLPSLFYKIDDNGNWVIDAAKPDRRKGIQTSHGRTDTLLAQMDARIVKLSQSHKSTLAPDSDQYKECLAHLKNLRTFRRYVLERVETYFNENEGESILDYLWFIFETIKYVCRSASADYKTKSRYATLFELLPGDTQSKIDAIRTNAPRDHI